MSRAFKHVRSKFWRGSHVRPRIWQALLLSPPVFGLWYTLRRVWWKLAYRPRLYDVHQVKTKTVDSAAFAVKHNLEQSWRITRTRTERLIAILRLALPKATEGRVLVIGPRNEGELLLMRAYGFPAKRMTAIDLISLSPNIELADMHDLPFADNSFDLCYACFIFSYTDRPEDVIREVHRVLRPGGTFVTGYAAPKEGRNRADRRLGQGLRFFRELLPNGIGEVYLNLTDSQQTGDQFYLAFAMEKSVT
jgi:SAM-dependent methyltransferase